MSRSPPRRVLLFLDLLLIVLIFGLAFAHGLELPGKLQLGAVVWLAVQQHLYNSFGPFAAVAEPLAIALAWLLAALLRRERPAGLLTLIAAISTTAGLAVWFAVVAPMNTAINRWTPASIPPDWTAYRDQWETGHLVHAALFAVAFCALAWAILLPVRTES